jgi:hypothetical protein
MTFIPSVLSIVDSNNSFNQTNTSTNPLAGTVTVTSGYNYLILIITSSITSSSGGIKIYMYDDSETPTVYYTDTYQTANTNYSRNYKIIKKNYYVTFTASSTPYNINLTSRLSTCELIDSINNSPSTFDFSKEFIYDAFGKLRVSNPTTLIDIKFPSSDTGVLTFKNNNEIVCSSFDNINYVGTNVQGYLRIRGQGTGYYISQSRKFNVYQPGKSLLVLMSGIIMPTNDNTNYTTGFTGRIGYYTNDPSYNILNTVPYDGLYYSYDSSGCVINLANKGSVTQYLQSNWNLDTMDGNGPSGINLQFNKGQLFVIDIEWLSVGRVRFGFYAYGKIHYCHQILNINTLSGPYMSSAMLPVRYELIGAPASSSTISNIYQICSTVISEGGYSPFGRTFSAIAKNIAITNIETPIIAIRGGGSNYDHQNIIPLGIDIVNTLNNNTILGKLRLYFDSDTTNAGVTSWNNIDSGYSVTQFSSSFSGFTAGNSTILRQLIFSGKGTNFINDLSNVFSNQTIQLTSNISGIADVLLITCQVLDGNNTGTIYTSLDIKEVY